MMKKFFILLAGCLLLLLSAPFTVKANAAEYDVRQYGAEGTDTQDDYKGIQEALNMALTTNDHITVVIPPGTYYLDSKDLHIYSNTTLKADGATIIRKAGNTSVLLKNWSENDTEIGNYSCTENITIQGGTWDGNASASDDPSNLFYFFHASNITISNVTMKNCCGHHFIEFVGVKDSTISNCTFSDFIKQAGVNYTISDDDDIPTNSSKVASIVSEAIQLDYAYEENSFGSRPYDGTVCQNIKVTGCTFTDCLSGIGNHHSVKHSTGWDFENNTFTNMSYSCFVIENVDNLSISGNTINSAYHFIEMNDVSAQNVLITNNTVTNSTLLPSTGIKLTKSSGINITNNTMSGYKYGIIALGSNASISGNTISNCELFAIRYTEGANSANGIKNNTIDNIKESGIGVKDFKGDIIGNKATNCGEYSIKATGGGSGVIKDNIYDQSFGIYNTSSLKTGSNKYLKDGRILPDPDYYTIYYHLNEKAKASTKTTVAKYDVKTRSLTIQELGFSVSGKRFIGWKGYKTDFKQWRFVDKSGKDVWAETQPSGCSYYLYREGHNFQAAARKGAEIHLYAVWESTGKDNLEVLSASVKHKLISKGSKQEFDVTTQKNAKYLFIMIGDSVIKTWDAENYSTVKNGKRVWKDLSTTITEDKDFVWYFRTGKKNKTPVSNKYFVFFSSLNCKKAGHDWGDPIYTWSDDYSKLTAKRVCNRDSSHVQTETVKTTSKTITQATMSAGGKIEYTSKAFKNKAFSVQYITVSVPKIKSSYKDNTGNYTIKKKMVAIYKGPVDKTVTSVTIPATITVSGVKIKVVGIGSKAFKGCKNLKTITIKSTQITDSYVHKKAFTGMPDNAIIKCPKSKLKKYKALFVKKGVKKAKSIK